MPFKSLGLIEPLLRAIKKKGYDEPSPIQEKAIPLILERKDLLASAQTGTGKTAGFTLPMLQILSQEQQHSRRPVRALVLTPTRELAAQVYENVREYSEYLDIRSTVIFGGVNQKPQVRTIQNGVDILVATPGRLLDLHNQEVFKLSKVEILVLDEADRMLDMGFLRDINRILKLMPERRQNLLFSATFSKEIKLLAKGFMHNPVLVEATPENSTVESIIQKIYRVDKTRKTALTIKLISEGDWQQVLIFTRTKHRANRLSQKLVAQGISAAPIHGNKSQGARTKALKGFKDGTIRVLVATDIAARGLDIPLLPHVINFELPNIAEDYVHRIGRTGRAGASGEAISLVSLDEIEYVRGIEKLLKQKFKNEVIEGFEPSAAAEIAYEEAKLKDKTKNKGGNRNWKGRSNKFQGNRNKKQGGGGGGNSRGGNSGGSSNNKPKKFGRR